jgi:ATP synthase protein I
VDGKGTASTSASASIGRRGIERRVRRIIWQQVGITAVISAVVFTIYGMLAAASAFVGGAIGFLTSWVYAWKMSVAPGSDPNAYLKAHFKAEGYKLGATCLLFAAVFIFFKSVAALPLFLTYGATLLVFWAALLTG